MPGKADHATTHWSKINPSDPINDYPLGNDRFRKKMEKTLQRQVGYARQGRPHNNSLVKN